MNGSCWRITRKRELVGEWREKLEIIITTIAVVVSHSSHIKVVIYFFLYPYWVLNWIFHVFIFFLYSFSSRVVYISGFQLNIVSLFLFSHPQTSTRLKSEFFFSLSIFIPQSCDFNSILCCFRLLTRFGFFYYFLFLYYRESYGISQKEGK